MSTDEASGIKDADALDADREEEGDDADGEGEAAAAAADAASSLPSSLVVMLTSIPRKLP